jgi:hypothetical protein
MLTQMMRLQIVMMADAWGWESEKDATKREQIVFSHWFLSSLYFNTEKMPVDKNDSSKYETNGG